MAGKAARIPKLCHELTPAGFGRSCAPIRKAWAGANGIRARPGAAYFWATYAGAELDLLMFKNGKRYGVEFKRADAPGLTRSMTTVLAELKLEHLSVIYPGDRHYALAERISVVPARELGGKDVAALITPRKRQREPR